MYVITWMFQRKKRNRETRVTPLHTYTYTCVHVQTMGWPRSVGSLKSYVSFVKEPYKRDDILQKRPIILRSLLIEATPYVSMHRIVFVHKNTCFWMDRHTDLKQIKYKHIDVNLIPLTYADLYTHMHMNTSTLEKYMFIIAYEYMFTYV